VSPISQPVSIAKANPGLLISPF